MSVTKEPRDIIQATTPETRYAINKILEIERRYKDSENLSADQEKTIANSIVKVIRQALQQ